MAAIWSPFFWVQYGLYRMGIHNLFGICLAVFSVSALAADPPAPRSNVSVTVNPTTGYYSSTNSTVRLPTGVSISPSAASVPVVSKYSGGLQQSIPTGITIDAIKKSAPLPVIVRADTQSVKNAAKTFFKSPKANLAFFAASAGLQALIDSVGWVMTEGSDVQSIDKNGPNDVYNGIPDGYISSGPPNISVGYTCSAIPSEASCLEVRYNSRGRPSAYWVSSVSSGYPLTGYYDGVAYFGGDGFNNPPAPKPVSSDVIDSTVDSNYTPDPTDWRSLSPYLDLDDVEITSAPTLSSNPKTTTIYDANGNPVEVQETNIWYDFDIRDNPSPSPSLDLKTRQETKTYKNGTLTGTTTTTGTDSAGTATGGGGSSVNIDIPTDCEFMPTVCAFLDWFKNDDTPEEPDLSALIDNRDFTESYSITGGSKQCPADYEFTVDFIGRTYGLSFEPACDFASKMYYFVMAAAYIFAAYITIGASRNG